MEIKPSNIINPNIGSTYDIDQQIESKEESERKNSKLLFNYELKDNFNHFNGQNESCGDLKENGQDKIEENFNKNQECYIEQEFEGLNDLSNGKKKNKKKNKKDETQQINEELILNNFDDKILNEMTLIYNIENEDEIKIFGEQFVNNNINNCYILINGQKNILCEYLELNESQKTKKTLEIKLIENKTIIDMSYMFDNCIQLNCLPDISKWNTKNVTNMSAIFSICKSLISLPDISKWDTKNVTNMSRIFKWCKSLISLPDISKWNTKNVTDMGEIFYNCESLIYLPDISKWNTKNVTNISGIFSWCKSLVSLPDISKWNTQNVTNISGIFSWCKSLRSLPDITKWNTKNVTDMRSMFENCYSLISLPDISKWELNKNLEKDGCL